VWDWGLVDKNFCNPLMTPRYLVPNMGFCSGKFDRVFMGLSSIF